MSQLSSLLIIRVDAQKHFKGNECGTEVGKMWLHFRR